MANEYKIAVSIEAPAQRVWDLIVDAPGYTRWNPSIVSIEGPIAAQGTIKLVSAVNPSRTFVLKVTTMEPPHRMVWSGGMPFGLFTGTRTYVIDAVAPARCRFTMSEVYTGILAGVFFKSIPNLNDSFSQFAHGLKAEAEKQASRPDAMA